MKAEQRAIQYVLDTLSAIDHDEVLYDYVLDHDEETGLFDTWDDYEQGGKADEYRRWVIDTFSFTAGDPDAGQYLGTIKAMTIDLPNIRKADPTVGDARVKGGAQVDGGACIKGGAVID